MMPKRVPYKPSGESTVAKWERYPYYGGASNSVCLTIPKAIAKLAGITPKTRLEFTFRVNRLNEFTVTGRIGRKSSR
jgi:hypothetical protein